MKSAREPASSRPKIWASLKKPHEPCPFAAPCGPRRKKKDRSQTSCFPSETSRFASISFDQQVQVSQGRTSYKIKGKFYYRGPWWWRPAVGQVGAPVSIQPSKDLGIFEKAPRILPVRRSLWPSKEEKRP